jgi:hypothetical protein
MPFLTATEQAEIRDHLNWDSASVQSHYVQTVLNPRLAEDMDAEKLVVVRKHLAACNSHYTQLAEVSQDFGLDEVKGVKFSQNGELRIGGMYAFFQGKLASSLNLKVNTESTTTGSSSGRIILDD